MGEIVNLRRARKRAAREADAATAQQNRVRFGRTRTELHNDRTLQTAQVAQLDGKRLSEDADCEPAPGSEPCPEG